MLTVELPWPPSVNHYWVHTRRGTFITEKGIDYRLAVQAKLRAAKVYTPTEDRLRLDVECYPPDRRRRDLDNILKGLLLVSLAHGGLMKDDNQVKRLTVEMFDEVRGIVHVTAKRHGAH